MSRFIKFLLVAVLVLGVLQWYAPRYVATRAAAEIAKNDGGVTPKIVVTALPFWMLLQGNFQQVYADVHNVTVDGLLIDDASLNWDGGQVSVSGLSHNKLQILKTGHMAATVVLDAGALSTFLGHQGSILHPVVNMASGVMTIKGQITLSGVTLPLDTQGTLSLSPDKQAIIFHPTSVDGIQLPVLTDLQIFQVSSLHLPVALKISSLRMAKNQLVIKADAS